MARTTNIFERYRNTAAPQQTERRVELVLVLVLVLILFQCLRVGWTLIQGPQIEAKALAADALAVRRTLESRSITGADSQQIQGRPLFWASRRPLEPVPEVIEQSQPEAGQAAPRIEGLTVTGAIGDGENGIAIVEYKGELLRMPVGSDLAGWTLLPIDGARVVFASAAQRDERRLTPRPVEPRAQPTRTNASLAPNAAGNESGRGLSEEAIQELLQTARQGKARAAADQRQEGKLSTGGPEPKLTLGGPGR
ncbi:MAG: hypothetical protein AAF662_14500 [Pseudomonadota bacterium]